MILKKAIIRDDEMNNIVTLSLRGVDIYNT